MFCAAKIERNIQLPLHVNNMYAYVRIFWMIEYACMRAKRVSRCFLLIESRREIMPCGMGLVARFCFLVRLLCPLFVFVIFFSALSLMYWPFGYHQARFFFSFSFRHFWSQSVERPHVYCREWRILSIHFKKLWLSLVQKSMLNKMQLFCYRT